MKRAILLTCKTQNCIPMCIILKALCAGEEGGAVHPHPVPDARHHKLPVLHQPEEGAEHLRASVRLHAGQLYPQVITGT